MQTSSLIIAILLAGSLLQTHAGDNYIFAPDGRVLGHISSNHSIYSETGQQLGFFQGDTLYNPSGHAIGYRSSNGYIFSIRDGSALGYFGH